MISKAGGRGNKIVDLKEITKQMIDEMHQAREQWGDNVSRITNRETQIANKIIKELRQEDRRKKESQHLKVETLYRYVTRLRTKIREAGFKHPSYEKNMNGIADKNEQYAERIRNIASLDYYESKSELTTLISEIRGKIEKSKGKDKDRLQSLVHNLSNKCLKMIDPAILKKLIRSDEDYEQRNKINRERIERYQDSSLDKVYDYKQIVSLIPELLTASTSGDGWQKVALGVALATGRRSYEVFYLSSFEAKSGRKIKVTGFAKKKAGEGLTESVTLPCLADPELVVESVKRLRSCERVSSLIKRIDGVISYDEKNEILNNSVHKQSNDCASRVLGEMIFTTDGNQVLEMVEGGRRATGVPFKLSRDLFVNCAYQEYVANGGTVKKDKFIRDTLHHEDIKTANSYKKLHSSEEVSAKDVKQVRKIKAVFTDTSEERIKGLEVFAGCEAIREKNAFIKAMDFVIDQVKSNPGYVVSTYNLRNAVPSETSKSGFKPIIRPALIGQFVKLIQDEGLDQPA